MPDRDIELNTGNFNKLRAVIHQNTGITIADNRQGLLESRLRGRLREIDEVSFTGYITRIGSDADEMQELINRVTTNETYCYRTPRIWDYFRDEFLVAFSAKKLPRAMKAWSAAASSGEEAHTIGLLCEQHRLKGPGFDYAILGTDISSRVIQKAQDGVYNGKSIARLRKEQPGLVEALMDGNDETGFRAKPEIKRRLTFKLHNLIRQLQGEQKFDIVFLRNVLIYFSNAEQERILWNVNRQMHPEGVLIIGESETLTRLDTPFEQVAPLIYRPGGD